MSSGSQHLNLPQRRRQIQPLSNEELRFARLRAERLKRSSVAKGLLGSLFPAQRRAAEDKSKRKLYCTTRRAGKTTGFLSECLDLGLKEPGTRYCYTALTRPSAEDIAWPILHELDHRHGLNLRFQEAKLRATLPNGSSIKLYGADRPGWMYRLYGQKLRKVGIDEAAFFGIDIGELIDDILEPCVTDLEGDITLLSIPGLVPRGYFYDAFSGEEPGWSKHEWSALDNPYVSQQFQEAMDRKIATKPGVENTPSFKRNYRGLWVLDTSSMAYSYQVKCNVESYEPMPGDHYVLGIDTGWHDASAFSLCVWNEDRPEFIELESKKRPEMLISEVADSIKEYMAEYPGIEIVGDASKRQVFEELRQRYGVPIHTAEKTDKLEWISMVNADFHSGQNKILVKGKTTPHILEMDTLGVKELPSGKKIEQPGQPNDCCDAYLYAYRQSYHYRYRPPEPEIKYGSPEYWARYEDRVVDTLQDRFGESDTPWWDN